MEGKIIGCWILSKKMNWEDEIRRLNVDYSTDLYYNTTKQIMQGGWERKRILEHRKRDSGSLTIELSGAPDFCDSIVKINSYKVSSCSVIKFWTIEKSFALWMNDLCWIKLKWWPVSSFHLLWGFLKESCSLHLCCFLKSGIGHYKSYNNLCSK